MALVSLDSSSCEVPCLILHSVVYRDITRQTKGLYRLEHVGSRRSGLAYLSRCNLGWFCHMQCHCPPNPVPARAPSTSLSFCPMLPRSPHTPPRRQLRLAPDHILFWTPSAFSSSSSTRSGSCKFLFHPISTPPSTIAHRTSAVPLDHRRPTPTFPLNPNPVQPYLRLDLLVLLSLFNFVFFHPSTLSHSAGELPAPPPLGLPSTHR
jgi:hypothetical protein